MEWFIYLVKASACTVLFFGFYLLVLRRLTFFKFNRFYLLGSLILSSIIPALQFEIKREIEIKEIQIPLVDPNLKPISDAPFQMINPVAVEYQYIDKPEINWEKIGFYFYLGITSLIILACAWRLVALIKCTRKYVKTNDGLKLVTKKKGFTNCSFFNYVFIDENSLSENELQVLLIHERVHAQQLHSVDKILLMLFKALFWFNPIIYLFDKALEQTHEYEADDITSADFGNQAYANLLFRLAVAKNDMPLIHNFVKSPVKDRIKMLFNSKSKNMKKLMYLLALPVVFGLVWLLSVEVVYAEKVVPEYKLKSGDVKVMDSAQAKSNTIVSQKQKIKRIVRSDTVKRSSRSVIPKINSFKKITGDTKNKISVMQDAVIEIKSDVLSAESVEWNKVTNILKAKNASLTNDLGDKTLAKLIIFDLNTGNYKSFSGKQDFKEIEIREIEYKPFIEGSKVDYKGDSVRFSKNKSIAYIYGHAEASVDQTRIIGSKILINSADRLLKAINATIISKNQKPIKADSIYYDISTSKAKLFGADLNP
ncbi:MAG: hypothetical protein EOO93_05330 [Pedobacter sp.]|nr:MAG: hypothetical protein EOO93_05330 [Pedobacter sp.]